MKRLKNLIDNVGLSSSTSQANQDESHAQQVSIKPTHVTPERPQITRHQPVTEDYSEDGMDHGIYEMKKLPADATQELIREIFSRLQAHLGSISKRLSSAILENQQYYDKELQRVRDLQKTLQIGHSVCNTGRNHMMSSQSSRSLHLLVRIQRRRNLTNLQMALNTIKTLEHTDVRLRELMEEERYPDAIQLCLECRKVSTAYGHYSCIKDLCVKLQDTLEQIEEQMDEALSKVCDNFDDGTYNKLQMSYKLLGKRQIAIDQLLMHFTTCIHRSTSTKLLEHAVKYSKDSAANLQKKSFTDLCNSVDPSTYIPCLLTFCKTLVNIIWCYQKVFNWHKNELSKSNVAQNNDIGVDHKYILQKLEKGRQRIWMDVQSRIKHILISADISNFEYEQFIKIVSIMNTFISVGARFCGNSTLSPSDPGKFAADLQKPIYQLSLQYFHSYHRKCLDELHMFLTNEAWESCPVNRTFSVLKLPEFKPFHAAARRGIVNNMQNLGNDTQEDDGFEDNPAKLFDVSVTSNSDSQIDDGIFGITADHDDDESLSHDGSISVQEGPILTNSSLNILRICGRYLSMCEVLRPISTDVVICMSHLFDYYLISLFHLFATHGADKLEPSKKLSATLDRIKRELISAEIPTDDTSNRSQEKIVLPTPSPLVNLYDRGSMFGFRSRVIAAESLVNLADQFKNLRPSLEKTLQSSQHAFLHQFYAQTVDTYSEVRALAYYAVATGTIDYELVLRQVPLVNWDIRDILSQHNKYVDELLRQCEILKSTLFRVLGVPSSGEIMKIIWRYCAVLCNNAFVEGYSSVKKCSNEGRALMQLDYQQFISKFDEHTGLSPVPGKGFVEAYLRAFYLSEDDFEVWKEKHPEYTAKQLSALLACISSSAATNYGKKNKKQKMRAMFDDITGKK